MSIDYFEDSDAPRVKVETIDDLHEALDILHSQSMDAGLPPDVLFVIAEAMDKIGNFTKNT